MERGKRCGEEALLEGTGGRKPERGLPHIQGGRSFKRGGGVKRVVSGASRSQGQNVAAGFWELGADR